MPRRAVASAVIALVALAACSTVGGAPSSRPVVDSTAASVGSTVASSAVTAPPTVAVTPRASSEPSTVPASAIPSAASSAASSTRPVACAETGKAGVVTVRIEDFSFTPDAITARPGQVVRFTNTGFESHNATVDGGGCATRTLKTSEHDGLVFTTVGSHPFHCSVHTWMTGTITIGQ